MCQACQAFRNLVSVISGPLRSQEAISEKTKSEKMGLLTFGRRAAGGGRLWRICCHMSMNFRSIGHTLPFAGGRRRFFPQMFKWFIFRGLKTWVFFIETASNEVPWASRAVHDLKRHKLVCAIPRRPSANQKCRAMSEKALGHSFSVLFIFQTWAR